MFACVRCRRLRCASVSATATTEHTSVFVAPARPPPMTSSSPTPTTPPSIPMPPPSPDVRIACPHGACPYTGDTHALLMRHLRRRHGVRTETYACDVTGCEAVFTSRDNLVRHRRRVHDAMRWRCTDCAATFGTALAYRVHARTAHSHAPLYVCDACDTRHESATAYTTHRMFVHGIGGTAHRCAACDTLFQSAWHQRRHRCRPAAATATTSRCRCAAQAHCCHGGGEVGSE